MLLRYSMNEVDSPSMFRGPTTIAADLTLEGETLSSESLSAMDEVLSGGSVRDEPGQFAGELPDELDLIVDEDVEVEPEGNVLEQTGLQPADPVSEEASEEETVDEDPTESEAD